MNDIGKLVLRNKADGTVIECPFSDIDWVIVAPARELMSPLSRNLKKVDALDPVIRVQLNREVSKEFSLSMYDVSILRS